MQDTSDRQPDEYLAIGAVVDEIRREFPAVTQSSLRFLEREGLLQPTRTPGGHRLYTAADVQRIIQIKRWQARRLSLSEVRDRLKHWSSQSGSQALTPVFLDRALRGDLAAARQAVLTADDAGVGLLPLFSDVLSVALTEIGRRWEHGEVLVSQEKEISELVRDLIAELTLRHAPTQPSGGVVVAAGVEGELHELGLRMISGLLRSHGHWVHYLGASVAPRFLVEAVRRHRPKIVLLSAKLEPNLSAAREVLATLSTEAGEPVPSVIIGGAVAVRHEADLVRLGAIPIVATSLAAAMHTIEQLLDQEQAPALGSPG